MVLLLLEHGASTSVLTPGGDLFRCDHFAGVQFILEQHHKRHCEEVFAAIYDKKGLQELTDIFLVKIDFASAVNTIIISAMAK